MTRNKKDPLDFWRASLAWLDTRQGERPAIHADHPECGYYRARYGRGAPWFPVAVADETLMGGKYAVILKDGGEKAKVVGDALLELWGWCGGNPVPKDAAIHAFRNGGKWPGDIPEPVAGVGDNSGELSFEEGVAELAEQALEWLTKHGIKDKVSCDMAANYRQRLLDRAKEAEAEREKEKRPIIEAGRKVDARWKPIVDKAKTAAETLRAALTKWMVDEEKRANEERRRKVEEEARRVAAERARIELERAKQMEDDPIAALTSAAPELPEFPTAPEPVRVHAGGQEGRKTALRTVVRYEVTDYDAAYEHLKHNAAVQEAIAKVAAAQCKAGVPVPGVRKIEEKVAA